MKRSVLFTHLEDGEAPDPDVNMKVEFKEGERVVHIEYEDSGAHYHNVVREWLNFGEYEEPAFRYFGER